MNYFFMLLLAAGALSSCGNTDASASKPGADSAALAASLNAVNDTATYTSITWIDSTYQDIGPVKKGQVAEVSWRLKNSGTKPLVIAQVSPGCGCTVAEKPEEPIMPGGEGTIRAKFNSSGQNEGEHRKYLSVTANTKGTTNYQLTFRVQVTN
ncbi:MAG TPA: DUF1573 domain-containing protein [Chitinophagaceae bacterium]|nr:DUF1573 domain-containing protein [Chitinophagaceae bacterium]